MGKKSKERQLAIRQSLELAKEVSEKKRDQAKFAWKKEARRATTNLGDLLIKAMWSH